MSPLLNIIAATTANHSVAAVHLEFKAFGEFVDLIEGIGGVLVGDGSYVGNGMRFRTALMLMEGGRTARLGATHSS